MENAPQSFLKGNTMGMNSVFLVHHDHYHQIDSPKIRNIIDNVPNTENQWISRIGTQRSYESGVYHVNGNTGNFISHTNFDHITQSDVDCMIKILKHKGYKVSK